jgi:hypothetical protein
MLGLELVMGYDIDIESDDGMAVVAYIGHMIIATKGSVQKHH